MRCKASNTSYDKFFTLSLPLPALNDIIVYVNLLRISSSDIVRCPIKYVIRINKDDSEVDFYKYVENMTKIQPSKITFVDIESAKCLKVLTSPDTISTRTLICDVLKSNEVWAFERISSKKKLKSAENRKSKRSGRKKNSSRAHFKLIDDVKLWTPVDA